MQGKRCPCCKKVKCVSSFTKDKSTKDGLAVYCKVCKYQINAKWRKTPEGKKRTKQYEVKYKKTKRKNQMEREYGPNALDFWNDFFVQQNGICPGCRKHQSQLKRNLCLDHDHENGAYRGLLCGRCNLLVGSSKKDLQILKNLVEYLESFYKSEETK